MASNPKVRRLFRFRPVSPDDSPRLRHGLAHHSNIQMEGYKSLKENQKVSFDVVEGPKGPAASNIKAI